MIDASSVVGFGLAAAPVVMSPGAGFAVFTTTMAMWGRRQSAILVGGMLGGMLVVGTLIVAAYPALATRVEVLRASIAAVGGTYLVALGFRNASRLLRGFTSLRAAPTNLARMTAAPAGKERFVEGVFTSLTNPGVFIIYLVIVPAFLPGGATRRDHFAVLVLQHLSMTAIWYAALWIAFSTARDFVAKPRAQATLIAFSSIALVVIGVRSILSAL